MLENLRVRQFCIAMSVLLVLCIGLGGCESLRKKFTRQKKKAQMEDQNFIPVLEPQDYPAPEFNPVLQYKEHYALIKVWYKDLWTALEEKQTDKRIRYTIKQIYTHIDAMVGLVQEDKKAELKKLRGFLKYFEDSINSPWPLRNVSRIQSDLRAFDRQLRGQLSFSKVKEQLQAAKVSAQ